MTCDAWLCDDMKQALRSVMGSAELHTQLDDCTMKLEQYLSVEFSQLGVAVAHIIIHLRSSFQLFVLRLQLDHL
jgi:hypothetical protein